MSQFMLLLYDDPSKWDQLSPEELQKAIEKYRAWRDKSVLSKRLADEPGRVIRPNGGKLRASDGPYSETKEVFGGFYTIEAADYAEAEKIAMDHPHLEYGGTMEIRKVWGT